MSVMEQKKLIRQQMRQRRQDLSPEELQKAGKGLSEQLNVLFDETDFPLAIYLSFDSELDTQPFIQTALTANRRVVLPIVRGKGKALDFSAYDNNSPMIANCYGIPEPSQDNVISLEEIKSICLPLTAFDRRGGRVGMGGGYYDITLASIEKRAENTQPKLIGLGYEFQEVKECPMEQHDQRLDYVVTPSEIIEINSH